MKMPVQAITQKYNKNKVEIITAYILALSKNQNKIIFQMELKNPWPSNVYPKNKALWMPALGNKQTSSRRQVGACPWYVI